MLAARHFESGGVEIVTEQLHVASKLDAQIRFFVDRLDGGERRAYAAGRDGAGHLIGA